MIDVVTDGGNQFFDVARGAGPQSVLGEIAEEALDSIQSRTAGDQMLLTADLRPIINNPQKLHSHSW